MTIEQMNAVIQDYCSKCDECAIREVCRPIMGVFTTNPEQCKEAYEIIMSLHEPDTTAKPANDSVNHPSHYNQGKYECIDVMVETFGEEATKNFCLLNAFKYIWRTGEKNGAEDVKKAIWYLNKFLELENEKHD